MDVGSCYGVSPGFVSLQNAGCRYHERVKTKMNRQWQLADYGLDSAWDLEDFVGVCQKVKVGTIDTEILRQVFTSKLPFPLFQSWRCNLAKAFGNIDGDFSLNISILDKIKEVYFDSLTH